VISTGAPPDQRQIVQDCFGLAATMQQIVRVARQRTATAFGAG